MTGYGRGEVQEHGCHFTVELRSINHRNLDPVIRLPRELMAHEDSIRKAINKKLFRGRVETYVSQEWCDSKRSKIVVDEEMAAAYCRAIEQLQERFLTGTSGLTAERLASFPDVLVSANDDFEREQVAPLILKALDDALGELLERRETEGKRLAADITARLQQLKDVCASIREKAPLVLERYRQKLQNRLEELHHNQDYDRQRFFTEVALFAERSNIDEEIVRLESHLDAFSLEIEKDGAIGRKLDFLLQEMNREANTVAAKGNDMEISRLVIEAKSEIEKIREQVQNIE